MGWKVNEEKALLPMETRYVCLNCKDNVKKETFYCPGCGVTFGPKGDSVLGQRFELINDKHNKFWEITWLNPLAFRTEWGAIGAKPQGKDKSFTSKYKALDEYNRIIGSKKKKGYVEVLRVIERYVAPPLPGVKKKKEVPIKSKVTIMKEAGSHPNWERAATAPRSKQVKEKSLEERRADLVAEMASLDIKLEDL